MDLLIVGKIMTAEVLVSYKRKAHECALEPAWDSRTLITARSSRICSREPVGDQRSGVVISDPFVSTSRTRSPRHS
jgi:hypothetical protein